MDGISLIRPTDPFSHLLGGAGGGAIHLGGRNFPIVAADFALKIAPPFMSGFGKTFLSAPFKSYYPTVIDTNEKLAAFLPVIKSAAWLAIDTEADSLHAYPEKVCLIQISTAAGDRLVDPLAKMDINPFLDALVGRELIFHAADYDLRLLRKHHDFTPSVIFDTMLAARLLGERQFGLGALVEKFLGVKLDKGPQKADWAQRPLTPRMEVYARNDTRFLKPLEEKLRAGLIAQNRLAWHEESCARLIAESSVPPVVDPDDCWRIKGSTFLESPALAVLRELWHWREREAVAASRPPFFVLSHESMVAIAAAVSEHQPFEPMIPPRMTRAGRKISWLPCAPPRPCRRNNFPKKSATVPIARPRRSSAGSVNWKKSATATRTSCSWTPRSSRRNPCWATSRATGISTRRS